MSMQRRCDILKCEDDQWYLVLGMWEHSYEDSECLLAGPFETEEGLESWRKMNGGPNPGGGFFDASGTSKVPDEENFFTVWRS